MKVQKKKKIQKIVNAKKKWHNYPLKDKEFNIWRLHFIDHSILSVNTQPAIKLKIKLIHF